MGELGELVTDEPPCARGGRAASQEHGAADERSFGAESCPPRRVTGESLAESRDTRHVVVVVGACAERVSPSLEFGEVVSVEHFGMMRARVERVSWSREDP